MNDQIYIKDMGLPANVSFEEYSSLFKQFFYRDYKDFVTFIINELEVDYQIDILEIGSRAGWVSLELARRLPDAKIIGIDSEKKLIEIAKKNQRQQSVNNVKFVCAEISKLDQFTNQSFDLIFSYKVLHLLDNQIALLNEINRLLTKGGHFALSDYRSDLKFVAKAAIWFTGSTMRNNFRGYWKQVIQSSYQLEDVVNLFLKTKLKDWKVRSSLFDFLIYR